LDNALDPSTVVVEQQLKDLLAQKPKAKQGTGANQSNAAAQKPKPKPKAKEGKKKGSDEVKEAIQRIAGDLATLSEDDRFKVLTRINGAFGFSPKGGKPGGSSGKKGKPQPKAKPKTEENSRFSRTLQGILLEETSRIQKKTSKSSTEKINQSLYPLHRYLLKKKAESKTADPASLIPFSTPLDDPKDLLKTIVSVTQEAVMLTPANVPDEAMLDSIIEASCCLIRGEEFPSSYPGDWKIHSPEARSQIPLTVPRTDEETAEATSRILAAKQTRKRKKTSTAKGSANESGKSVGSSTQASPTSLSKTETSSLGPASKKSRSSEGTASADDESNRMDDSL
jgi:hypothetical protein